MFGGLGSFGRGGLIKTGGGGIISPFPFVAATATSEETAAVTNHTVTLSANNTDDLMIAFVCAGAGQGFSWPGGWTEIFEQGTVGGQIDITAAYRKSNGAEPATIEVGNGAQPAAKSTSLCLTFNNHADPDVNAPDSNFGLRSDSTTSIDSPNINPSLVRDFYYLHIGGKGSAGASNVTVWDSNYDLNRTELEATEEDSGDIVISGRHLRASNDNPAAITISAAKPVVAFGIAVFGLA